MINKEFLFAGKAIFTVGIPFEYQETLGNDHYTYKIELTEFGNGGKFYFASLLTGPQNTSDYTYMAKWVPSLNKFMTTIKSKFTNDSIPLRLLNRVVAKVLENDGKEIEKHGFQVMHNGRCGRCQRMLTRIDSISIGMGSSCAKKT